MVKRIFLLTTIVFFFCLTSQNFSQVKSNKFGFGASVGNISKVQLSYTLSKQFQISFDLGTFIYSNSDAEVINLGASFKYFFSTSNLSTYLGTGASVTSIDETTLNIYIPFGVQKFVSDNLALFAGINPIITVDNFAIILGAELGATFYF